VITINQSIKIRLLRHDKKTQANKVKNKQDKNNMLSYHRETALQGALVLAKSGRLELGNDIFRTL